MPLTVPLPLAASRTRTASRVQWLALLTVPYGGQARARRNAWAGMSADAARGRDRRQAEAALAAADVRALAAAGRRDRAGA